MPRRSIKVKKEVVEESIDVVQECDQGEDDNEDDEWEEMTMVVTVNGILDADLVRDAVKKELVKLRYAETENPVLQINNSLYTGTWTQDLGTNIILQSKEKDNLEVISCTSNMLQAEKALLTSIKSEQGKSIAAQPDSVPKSSLSRTQPRK